MGSANYVFGRIHLEDLNCHACERSKLAAYADSKLAIMLFVDELARRGVRAYVADPGGGDTDITRDSTGLWRWLVEHRALAFLAKSPSVAARSSYPGGDDGPAQRDIFRAALQTRSASPG